MINPTEIVDNLVALLRDIPEFLPLVDGDEERIFAYHDRYPQKVSLEEAKYRLLAPGIMVAWQGTSPGSFGASEVWKHEISITLRAKPESGEDPPAGYYALFRQITRGVPTSSGQPLINATVHPSCQPMDTPSIRRQTDAAGIDYFEITMSFTEIGDD